MAEYTVIRGEFVIVGKEPDGDSIRFRANNSTLFGQLRNGNRVRLSPVDATVQLRFQGIDAPELHYQGEAQPFGRQARNVLLNELDYGLIRYSNLTVTSAERRVYGAVLAKEAEAHGRPIAYLLWESDADGLQDGTKTDLDAARLKKTMNYLMLEQGMAFPLFYTSMPAAHREVFRAAAKQARQDRIGLWPQDLTRGFDLTDNASIGPDGQLIYPKLFRRCTDYLHDVDHQNFTGDLREWMEANSANDPVTVGNGAAVRFTSLVTEAGARVSLAADVLELVFAGD
jgi:endonuclease YncB( thermonuclease family)